MAHSISASHSFIALAKGFRRPQSTDALAQCLAPRTTRTYATVTEAPVTRAAPMPLMRSTPRASSDSMAEPPTADRFRPSVLATVYRWPSMEPCAYKTYQYDHLNVPLRKDILHRAVVFEGDNTRQGTASTKHRTQVHGSNRKIRPQKGTGMARLSNRKSPSIRGGGVAFGPHPRDFSTDLPKKVYDLAFRTALSYRYKKGELIVVKGDLKLDKAQGPRFLHNFFEAHGWGKGNGRTLLVAKEPHVDEAEKYETAADEKKGHMCEAMDQVGEHGELQFIHEVDVKDLLSCGRIIIEAGALKDMLNARSDVRAV